MVYQNSLLQPSSLHLYKGWCEELISIAVLYIIQPRYEVNCLNVLASLKCLCFWNKQGCRDVQLKAENNRITVSPYATSCYHIYSTIAKKYKRGSLKSKNTTQRQISETAVHKYSSAVAGLYCIPQAGSYHEWWIIYKPENENQTSPHTHHHNQTANLDSAEGCTVSLAVSRDPMQHTRRYLSEEYQHSIGRWWRSCVAGRDQEHGRFR